MSPREIADAIRAARSMGDREHRCPYCFEICFAEYVDIGVGQQRVTPFECSECGAREMTSEDHAAIDVPWLLDPRPSNEPDEEERQTRWWKGPGS